MSPPTALLVRRRKHLHSRVLIGHSRALIASAKALITQSRQSIARQSYLRIVCAWCEQTMRWQRCEETVRGQNSHSICFACWASLFPELDQAGPAPPHSGRESTC